MINILVNQAKYSAVRAGIIGFNKTAALALARYNVKVNTIRPGYIATEIINMEIQWHHLLVPGLLKSSLTTR